MTLTHDLDLYRVKVHFYILLYILLIYEAILVRFFYIVGLTNSYKKVSDNVYVTVTFFRVTGAVNNVTCSISAIFVTNRARNSILVSIGRFLRALNLMVVLPFPSDECKGL